MSSITKPGTPPPSTSTKPQLLFLGLGLLSFALLWAAPVALLVWVLGMFFGSIGIAEMLERTRGLAPTTYGGAFWLAVVVTVAVAALEVRAMIRGTESRSWAFRFITRPSTAYFALLMPTVLLVRLDTRGTDVPDILTTTLLLCCLGYVWFILPLGMAAVAWRLTWWMWQKGSGSSFAAGVLGMLGLSFATCTPLVCAVDDEEEPWPPAERAGEAFGRGFERARGQDAVDGSHTLMVELAEVLDEQKSITPSPSPSETYQTDSARFDGCVEDLFRGGTNSLREQKISSFTGQYFLDRSVAQDIVQDAILELCLRHARIGSEPFDNLAAVFNKKADDRRRNWHRGQGARNRCAVRLAGRYVDPRDLPAVESETFERAYCSLDEDERLILELSALDYEAGAIGEPLGLSAETVRQRKHRAIKKVRHLLQPH